MIKKLRHITLLDIIIFGSLVVLGGLFLFFLFRKQTYLTVTVRLGEDSVTWPRNGVAPWYSRMVTPGLVERDVLGRPNVEVLKVFTYLVERDKQVVYATLKLRVVYSRSEGAYTFRSRPVLVGNTIRVNPGGVLMEGLVTYVDEQPNKWKTTALRVETQAIVSDPAMPYTYGIHPLIADAIQVGETVEDARGNTVIKIVGKKVLPARRTVISGSGTAFSVEDPYLKDLYLTLEVNADKQGNLYYVLDTVRLTIGENIPLQLQKVAVYPIVLSISE